MPTATIKSYGILTLWGLTLAGTLSVARWPGNWGHSVCGVWGCGPPLQALVACHVSWVVVLAPPALYLLSRASQREAFARALSLTSIVVLILAVTLVAIAAAHEYLTWYATASDFQKIYFWRRVGFVLITTVEVPLLEVAGLATIVLTWLHLRCRPKCDPERIERDGTTSTEAGNLEPQNV